MGVWPGALRAVMLTGCGRWSGGLGCGGEGDFHAGVEAFQLADLVAALAAGVEPGVVVGAELAEAGGRVADDDPGDLADGAGDRDDGFLLAAAAGDAPVARAEVGVGLGGGHGSAAERGTQVGVALAGAAVLGSGAGLDGAAGQPGPGGGVARGGELGLVQAELGDDDLGGAGADAGELIEPLGDRQYRRAGARAGRGVAATDLPAARTRPGDAGDARQPGVDLFIQPGHLAGHVVDQVQQDADLQGVDVAEPAGQRRLQLGGGGLEPPVAQGGQPDGVAVAVHQRGQEPPARHPHQVGDHGRTQRQYPARMIVPGARLATGHADPGKQRRHGQHTRHLAASGPPRAHGDAGSTLAKPEGRGAPATQAQPHPQPVSWPPHATMTRGLARGLAAWARSPRRRLQNASVQAVVSDLIASMLTMTASPAKTPAAMKVMAWIALGRVRTLSRKTAAVQPTVRSPTRPTIWNIRPSMRSCTNGLLAVPRNCGRKAMKNSMTFGLVRLTISPRRNQWLSCCLV